VYNSELANTWGNLASRVIAMVEKYFAGAVPRAAATDLDRGDESDIREYHNAMDGSRGFLLHEGIRSALATVVRGNEYVQTTQPWALAKSPDTRAVLEAALGSLVRSLARQCVLLFPFMPVKAAALWAQLGAPGRIEDQRFDTLMQLDATGWNVRKGDALFPKAATAT
jgi:methionyl-tRNA synthetase